MTRISDPNDIPLASNQPAPANGKTILIAEDDPFISRMYETKLTRSGFSVTVKNNGRDAYEAIKVQHPNLILLDLSMPELTGFEVLSALQNDSYDFSTSPVIILTNSSRAEDAATAKKFGVDYLVKAELTPTEVLMKIYQKLGMPALDAPA